jgi:hypothetical protein
VAKYREELGISPTNLRRRYWFISFSFSTRQRTKLPWG